MKALSKRGHQRTALEAWSLRDGLRNHDPHDFMWLVDWKAYGLPYCSVYIIAPDNHWPCKVGISIWPEKRLMSLQTSVWRPLKVFHCFACTSVAQAKALEKRVHEDLTEASKWLHGEWFDMRPNDAADMVRFAAALTGIEITEKIESEEILADVKEGLRDILYGGDNLKKRIDARTYHF